MITKLILLFALLLTFTITTLAQVKITPNKVTYERKGKNVSGHKKTFTITYPKISDNADNIAIKTLVNTISYWKNFDTTLEEHLSDYTWLYSLDYKINYNKNNILDIQLLMEGSGAYPSTSIKNLVINQKTGKKVQIADVFTNMGQMLVKIDKAQKVEIRKAKLYAKKDGENIDGYLNDGDYSNRKLEDFSVSDKGVTFLYDYGFPHVVRALQPDGKYFFTFTELKPFIKRDGLLGQFVR